MKRIAVLVICVLMTWAGPLSAEVTNEDLLKEIRELRGQVRRQEERIDELEARLSKEEVRPDTIQFADGTVEDLDNYLLGGLAIEGGATFIIQGTDNANGDDLSNKGEDVTDASYSMDLIFEKEFIWKE